MSAVAGEKYRLPLPEELVLIRKQFGPGGPRAQGVQANVRFEIIEYRHQNNYREQSQPRIFSG